jgi:hypothetical protein
MLYMCLISYDPTMPFEGPVLQPQHAKLEQELRELGVFVSGAGLMPVEQGASVRIRDGRPLATDGPFAETKEVAGGYYLLDCETQEQAIEYARRIPTEKRSWVDVRPIALFHPNIERIAAMSAVS